jgi:hypothetical protein
MHALRRLLEKLKPLRYRSFRSFVFFRRHLLAHFENRRHVATPITIVGRTPYRHKSLVKMILSSLHDQLMRPGQTFQGIDLMKFVRDALAKEIACPPRTQLPRRRNVLRIAPHQIAKGAFVGNFLIAINRPDLIQGSNIRTQTSVDAEYLFVDQGGQSKAVKALDAMSPDAGVSVFAQAFVVKAVDLSNLSGLGTTKSLYLKKKSIQ